MIQCNIGDEGLMCIARALAHNSNLRTIFFSDAAVQYNSILLLCAESDATAAMV